MARRAAAVRTWEDHAERPAAAWLVATRGSTGTATDWPLRTIGYLAITGAAFMVAALVAFTSFAGAPPGSRYKPATFENGKVVPGHFE